MGKTLARILILMLLGAIMVQPSIDPDLGWHLRYGEYFFRNKQVLRDNILSFVWPDYKWVQASWGYDLLLYQIFIRFGFFGLSIAASIISLIIFFILARPVRRYHPVLLSILAILFASQTAPLWGGSLRSQTSSTLFFALVLVASERILNRVYYPTKPRPWLFIALPILFLFWANMHGGFSLGLGLLLLEWFIYGFFSLVDRKTWKLFGISLLACALIVLINPWGLRIYEESLKHSTNINLATIAEWTPLLNYRVESIVALGIVSLAFIVLITKRQLALLPLVVVLLVMTYLTFSASRFIILLGVLETYVFASFLRSLDWNSVVRRIAWITAILLLAFFSYDALVTKIFFLLPTPAIVHYSWTDYCILTGYCDESLTSYMLTNLPMGNGYHPYNYGGYLSWRIPELKTFVDGRMAAWKENGNTPPVLEGDWVISQHAPAAFRKFESEYSFAWAIVPSSSPIRSYLDSLTSTGAWQKRYENPESYSYFVKTTP